MMDRVEKKLNVNKSKAYQRSDDEHRVKPYMDWHRTLSRGLYMLDVDSVEWRFKENGELAAVGVIEITRVGGDEPLSEGYFIQVLRRFEEMQGKATIKVAEALGTHAYITVFRYDCSEFFVYNLTLKGAWVRFDPEQYHKFLKAL